MNERLAFMRSIIDAPEDDMPRLAFADWLQEHDEEDRAEFIRTSCEIARFPGNPYEMSIESLENCEIAPQDDSDPKHVEAAKFCQSEMRRLAVLRKREAELLTHDYGTRWAANDLAPTKWFPSGRVLGQWRWRRGFVEKLICPSREFFGFVDELYWRKVQTCPTCAGKEWVTVRGKGHKKLNVDVQMGCKKCGGSESTPGTGILPEQPCPETAQPIRKVTLTDTPQLIFTGDGCFTWEGYPCHVLLPKQHHYPLSSLGLKECLEATFPGIEFEVANG